MHVMYALMKGAPSGELHGVITSSSYFIFKYLKHTINISSMNNVHHNGQLGEILAI